MPGRRASSVARSSIADTSANRLATPSEWKLEREVHAASELAHFLLCQISGLFLRLDDRYANEILQHLDVRGVHNRGVDLDLPNLTLPVRLDGDHAAAGRRAHGASFEVILNLLQLTLHLLRLLQDLHHVGHRYAWDRVKRPKSYPALASRRKRRWTG